MTSALYGVNRLVDAVFVADMGVQACLAYADERTGVLVQDGAILRHYARSWFAIDLCSILPFDLLGGVGRGVRLIRVLRLLKLARVLKAREERRDRARASLSPPPPPQRALSPLGRPSLTARGLSACSACQGEPRRALRGAAERDYATLSWPALRHDGRRLALGRVPLGPARRARATRTRGSTARAVRRGLRGRRRALPVARRARRQVRDRARSSVRLRRGLGFIPDGPGGCASRSASRWHAPRRRPPTSPRRTRPIPAAALVAFSTWFWAYTIDSFCSIVATSVLHPSTRARGARVTRGGGGRARRRAASSSSSEPRISFVRARARPPSSSYASPTPARKTMDKVNVMLADRRIDAETAVRVRMYFHRAPARARVPRARG